MARFQVDIEKRLGSEFWSNVYQVQAPDLASAEAFGQFLVAAERASTAQAVTFTRYRTSSVAMNDGVYAITSVAQPGQRVMNSILPLFNTLRIDINTSPGRPSRKYYRAMLDEFDIAGDAVTTATFLPLTLALSDLFAETAEMTGLVDPQGQLFNSITIHPFVQMRQLRRSRRRRTNGGGIFQ